MNKNLEKIDELIEQLNHQTEKLKSYTSSATISPETLQHPYVKKLLSQSGRQEKLQVAKEFPKELENNNEAKKIVSAIIILATIENILTHIDKSLHVVNELNAENEKIYNSIDLAMKAQKEVFKELKKSDQSTIKNKIGSLRDFVKENFSNKNKF